MTPSRFVVLALHVSLLLVFFSPSARADSKAVPTRSKRLLTDFTESSPDLGWYVVNDGVMGGKSEGGFKRVGAAIEFTGTTNTDGGGFSSIRTGGLQLDLSEFDGIRVRVRGDGRRYTWRLTTDARWRGRPVSYWAHFETRANEWRTVDVPFDAFVPQWRGRMLSGYELDPASIRGMGLMIYDKRDGAFALSLDSVHAYEAPEPFSLSDLRWNSRVLVVSAASLRGKHVAAQLAEIEGARRGFDDRDLLLVVLLDEVGSRVADRALTAADVLAVRRELEIDAGVFAVRLVGKDGEVKHSADTVVTMDDLYALIDRMPMRRDEMDR